MARDIYGVDIDGPFSVEEVRDAVLRCFTAAHDEVLEETMFSDDTTCDLEETTRMKQLDVRMLVGQMFSAVGGDFDHPTKASIVAVVGELQAYAANFRNPEIIGKHAGEISLLLEKLPD